MSFDCRLLPDTDERAFISNLAADRQRSGCASSKSPGPTRRRRRRPGTRRCSRRSRRPCCDYVPQRRRLAVDLRRRHRRALLPHPRRTHVRPAAEPVRRRGLQGLPRHQRAPVARQPAARHADRLRRHAADRRALARLAQRAATLGSQTRKRRRRSARTKGGDARLAERGGDAAAPSAALPRGLTCEVSRRAASGVFWATDTESVPPRAALRRGTTLISTPRPH